MSETAFGVTAEAPAPAKKKAKEQTMYVVLELNESYGSWVDAGNIVAAVNAEAAVRKVAKGAGSFVAIPTRSWKPLTVKVETVEKVTFG